MNSLELRLTELEKQSIVSRYLNNENINKIALDLKLSKKAVRNILTKRNITIISYRGNHKKYYPYEDYFNKIDTNNKAYFLGFLYADGYNYESNNSIVVALHKKDESILELLKTELNYPVKLYLSKNTYKILRINNTILSSSLAKLGCIQNKTHILTFPSEDILPVEFQSHFMRGYFDGDGCVTTPFQISITGTSNFLIKYQEILIKYCKKVNITKFSTRHMKSPHIQTMHYAGSKVLKDIYTFLYKDAEVFLERKKEKFDYLLTKHTQHKECLFVCFKGITLKTDEKGRICLTDIWLYFLKPKYKEPAQWKRSKHFSIHLKHLPDIELEFTSTPGGLNYGTFAKESIAALYFDYLNN